MDSSKRQRYLIDCSFSLRGVMIEMDRRGQRNLFLVDNGYLKGSISDGDIRRALIAGANLDEVALYHSNQEVISVQSHLLTPATDSLFSRNISLIPVLDENGRVIEILEKNMISHIPISEPNLGQEELALVQNCLQSSWISSQGSYVSEFEFVFRKYVDSLDSVTVSNGTVGLVLALKSLDIGIGDEVLVPNLTFGATANAVIQVGAIPILVDVDYETMFINIDEAQKKVTKKTKAVIPVYLYGKSGQIQSLLKFAQSYNLKVIEDAAEALGTFVQGKHAGTFGDIGVFSFFANKTITTGEGGMLVFASSSLADRARKMRSHGFHPDKKYWHDEWGSNFRLTNIQAAIGVGQMGKIKNFVRKKREIASAYSEMLMPLQKRNILVTRDPSNPSDSFWLSTVQLTESKSIQPLQDFLSKSAIETRRFFYPLNIQPAFRGFASKDDFPVSLKLFNSGLCLPSSTKLSYSQIEFVCRCLLDFFK